MNNTGAYNTMREQRGGRMLFPISVSNKRFSFERVRSALRPLLADGYEELIFLIADKLYLYNKCRRVVSGQDLGITLRDFTGRNRELETRKAWVRNLEKSFKREGENNLWTIVSSDDVSDERYAHVHRRLLIAFATIGIFREEIKSTTRSFLSDRFGSELKEEWLRLSEYYLLEELALNVRVRVWGNIHDEFYLGDYHAPLVRMYAGHYGFSVADLTDMDVRGSDFRFHRLEAEPAQWKVA